jgi:hypothetical protein
MVKSLHNVPGQGYNCQMARKGAAGIKNNADNGDNVAYKSA